jgi:hypothetical protein
MNCPVQLRPQPVRHAPGRLTHCLASSHRPDDPAVHIDGGMGCRWESNCWIGRHREGDPRRQNRFGNVPEHQADPADGQFLGAFGHIAAAPGPHSNNLVGVHASSLLLTE